MKTAKNRRLARTVAGKSARRKWRFTHRPQTGSVAGNPAAPPMRGGF